MIDLIIPNYNGWALLPTCLDAVAAQTRRDFRVTVVDDGSTDASVRELHTHYPWVTVLALPTNQGLTVALNTALAHTHAPFVVLLNNDTEAEPRWLERLVGALERWPSYAFAASKLRLFDQRDRLHAVGDWYSAAGVPGNRGVWEQDRGQYDAVMEVWGPCAGAAAYRRDALERLAEHGKVFDEDLWMYCEDVDLNFRARLRGVKTILVPNAVVYHKLSATGGGTLASYYCGRNFVAVWAKNMPTAAVRRYWPRFVWAQLRITGAALWHVRGAAARARLRGQWAGLRDLPLFLRKRSSVVDPPSLIGAFQGS